MRFGYILLGTGPAVFGDFEDPDPEKVRQVAAEFCGKDQRVVLVEKHTPPWKQDATETVERTCPTCGNTLLDHACKLKCSMCGYFASCSEF